MYIQTKRLELKPITENALPALVELLTDDVVKQTYMVPDFADREAAMTLARRLKTLSEEEQPIVMGVYRDDRLIGMMNETDRADTKIEIGYAILPQFHNRGYASEALTAVIGWLFDRGFREVVTGAFETNVASIRVMIKSGMGKLDHTDEIQYRGRVHRCVYYGAFAKPR